MMINDAAQALRDRLRLREMLTMHLDKHLAIIGFDPQSCVYVLAKNS